MMCAVQWLGASEAVAADLTVVAAGTSRTDRLASLVVDVRSAASEPVPPESFSVTARGVPQPIQAVPVFSDQLAVGIVVDASEAGRPALQAGLAGAANFVLEQPTSGAAVVADTSPPLVMSTADARPADVVRALSAIRAGRQRQTSAAVSLAVRELGTIPAHSRMVVLYTTAADAGGEPAADLAARLIDAHILLAVVSTSAEVGYWLEVTRRTGGVLVTPETHSVFAAFDQVADAMRSRYLLTFQPTDQLPLEVSVRVDTAEGSVTADAVVPDASANTVESDSSARGDPAGGTRWPLILAMAALIAVVFVVFLVQTRRIPRILRLPRRPRPDPADSGMDPPQRPPMSALSLAGTNAPPPRPRQPPASTPVQDHELGPLDDQHSCMCGCGMPVRPGRAFVNWEHKTRWMSRRGGGTQRSSP